MLRLAEIFGIFVKYTGIQIQFGGTWVSLNFWMARKEI